jgi:hypothetical protein
MLLLTTHRTAVESEWSRAVSRCLFWLQGLRPCTYFKDRVVKHILRILLWMSLTMVLYLLLSSFWTLSTVCVFKILKSLKTLKITKFRRKDLPSSSSKRGGGDTFSVGSGRGNRHFWNVGKFILYYTAQHPRRQSSCRENLKSQRQISFSCVPPHVYFENCRSETSNNQPLLTQHVLSVN